MEKRNIEHGQELLIMKNGGIKVLFYFVKTLNFIFTLPIFVYYPSQLWIKEKSLRKKKSS